MKVALFASAFYPHVGGVEELVRQLAHEYRSKGVSVIVITNRWPRSLPESESYEGIPVYRLPMRVPEGSLKARLSYRLSHASIVRQMLHILRKHHIDLLHVHCVSSNGHYALLAKQALSLPLIVTTHGERTIDASQIYQRSAFFNAILRRNLREADYVTAPSQDTLNDIKQYYGDNMSDRSSVIYNGIQLSEFEPVPPFSHPRPYILAIGRLVSQKGFDVLIEAFAQAKVASYDLLIAGEGRERQALEALVHKHRMQEQVKFLGRADRSTAVALFKGCSFFVLPSRQEPFGIVNLEAMAAGKSIIATRVGGVPEIVLDKETAILVQSEDAGTLAEAINQLASDPALRCRLGAAGYKRVQQFSWRAIAEQYLSVYENIATSRTKSTSR